MIRYFLVADDALPTTDRDDGNPNVSDHGDYHYLALGSHGTAGTGWNLLAMTTSSMPHSDWLPLPPLIDQRTLVASVVPVERLADIGVAADATTLDVALIAGSIMPSMGI